MYGVKDCMDPGPDPIGIACRQPGRSRENRIVAPRHRDHVVRDHIDRRMPNHHAVIEIAGKIMTPKNIEQICETAA